MRTHRGWQPSPARTPNLSSGSRSTFEELRKTHVEATLLDLDFAYVQQSNTSGTPTQKVGTHILIFRCRCGSDGAPNQTRSAIGVIDAQIHSSRKLDRSGHTQC